MSDHDRERTYVRTRDTVKLHSMNWDTLCQGWGVAAAELLQLFDGPVTDACPVATRTTPWPWSGCRCRHPKASRPAETDRPVDTGGVVHGRTNVAAASTRGREPVLPRACTPDAHGSNNGSAVVPTATAPPRPSPEPPPPVAIANPEPAKDAPSVGSPRRSPVSRHSQSRCVQPVHTFCEHELGQPLPAADHAVDVHVHQRARQPASPAPSAASSRASAASLSAPNTCSASSTAAGPP